MVRTPARDFGYVLMVTVAAVSMATCLTLSRPRLRSTAPHGSPAASPQRSPAPPPAATIARWSSGTAGSSVPRKISLLIVAVRGRGWYVLGAVTPSVGSTVMSRARIADRRMVRSALKHLPTVVGARVFLSWVTHSCTDRWSMLPIGQSPHFGSRWFRRMDSVRSVVLAVRLRLV